LDLILPRIESGVALRSATALQEFNRQLAVDL
jgi:hypothetical protein